ncbi:MAG: O-antigen ligase family protein [Candidatus Shapirobacteria bacterium]|nr:O-antigen ligase family protein [Candidatus Shapirobacteria bacterium]MDD4410308.1 O-antigen ligase family protein [Candidatus Shapirobacteria bacterium]
MKSFVKPVRFLFLALLFLTPIIFTQSNSELFELPKMYFVYLLTILITTFHLINVIQKQVPLIKKNFLNIPLALFLLSQIISTVYSIDPHTSFFGYYSRLNGGLLSLICYSILYLILSVYINSDFKTQIINFSLLSGFLISIYAIAQHFGIDKNWWVQDVQSRVFSTLGQPNWLAAYLCILIPFSIFKFLESKSFIHKSYFLFLTSSFYLSLLFTKSKSGIIACLISLAIYFAIYFFSKIKSKASLSRSIDTPKGVEVSQLIGMVGLILILSIFINNPIKDSFTSFIKTKHISPIILEDNIQPSKILITSSGDIRKIVWTGAIDLWKKFPVFGTGVETFAYSYYWTRPIEHNLTSEWDYLYNKAHNEYINYLATTGAVGFTAYCFIIISVLFYLIKNFKLKISNLTLPILASYLSILITNSAGFSVVITSLFFFLLPALLNQDQKISPLKKPKTFLFIPIFILSLFLTIKTILFYLADITFAKAENYDSINNYQNALIYAQTSHKFNPKEPLYTDKLATIYSKIALNSENQDDVDQAVKYSDLTIQTSPANINFWKQRAQTYLYLSGVDSKYFSESITALTKASLLAPTDAKIYYSIGQFLETANLKKEAIPYYQKAIELKPNYDYTYFALGKIYLDQKETKLAKENLQKTVDYSYPTNTEAEKLLKNL